MFNSPANNTRTRDDPLKLHHVGVLRELARLKKAGLVWVLRSKITRPISSSDQLAGWLAVLVRRNHVESRPCVLGHERHEFRLTETGLLLVEELDRKNHEAAS